MRGAAKSPIVVVGRALSRDAVLLARVAAPDDAEIARRIARALKDPARVAQFIGEPEIGNQVPA
jgi:hypothetical protein